MKSKRIISIALLISILAATSCGDSTSGQTETTTSEATVTSTQGSGYDYPQVDFNNEEFTILNPKKTWGMNTELDFEEQSGEKLQDAIYNRNRKIEEIYNFKLKINEVDFLETANILNTQVMAGDDTNDAAYLKADFIAPLLSANMFVDLTTIPELRLNESWWNKKSMTSCSLGESGSIYFGINDFSLAALDLTWCIGFNESMLEDLNLEKPYQLVRDGKWTLDKLGEYTKAGANLNGEESFALKSDGKSIYGLASYSYFAGGILNGGACFFTTQNNDNQHEFTLESERLYSLVEKYTAITGAEGQYISINDSAPNHYEDYFKNGRSLLVGCEVKSALIFRSMDDTFGLVPMPKLDEAQESYYSNTSYQIPVLAIPVTNNDATRAGIILDTLAYHSTKDVTPVYYDVTLAQKGLRNEESIEMLDIIRDTRYFEPGMVYGWTTALFKSISTQIDKGDGNISSLIASNKSIVEQSIKDTYSKLASAN